MTPKKKLGIFMPPRPKDHILMDWDRTSIGVLYPELSDPIVKRLRNNPNIELVEGLDFRNASVVDGKVYFEDYCLNELDRFFWYCEVYDDPGSYDIEILQTLSRDTEVICDPHAFETAVDKYKAHLVLKDSGVAVPECILFDQRVPDKINDVLNDWGGALLKPRRGGWGKGITFIDSGEKLRDIMGYVRTTSQGSPDQGFFLERYHRNDLSKWASLTMINGEVTLGYRKKVEKFVNLGGGRHKVLDADEKGGGVVLADLTDEHYLQAEKAEKALGVSIIGFDMIWTENGPVIVDENTRPGTYADLYQQLNVDPSRYFTDLILKDFVNKPEPIIQ